MLPPSPERSWGLVGGGRCLGVSSRSQGISAVVVFQAQPPTWHSPRGLAVPHIGRSSPRLWPGSRGHAARPGRSASGGRQGLWVTCRLVSGSGAAHTRPKGASPAEKPSSLPLLSCTPQPPTAFRNWPRHPTGWLASATWASTALTAAWQESPLWAGGVQTCTVVGTVPMVFLPGGGWAAEGPWRYWDQKDSVWLFVCKKQKMQFLFNQKRQK